MAFGVAGGEEVFEGRYYRWFVFLGGDFGFGGEWLSWGPDVDLLNAVLLFNRTKYRQIRFIRSNSQTVETRSFRACFDIFSRRCDLWLHLLHRRILLLQQGWQGLGQRFINLEGEVGKGCMETEGSESISIETLIRFWEVFTLWLIGTGRHFELILLNVAACV